MISLSRETENIMNKSLKSFLFIITCLLAITEEVYSRVKVCEIKYDLRKGEESSFARKLDVKYNSKYPHENYHFNCYQIGLEHDQNKQPISNKPIFACCQKA